MTRVLDARLKIGLLTLAAIAAAMVARPAHSEPAVQFPQAAAEAICQLSLQVSERDQAGFWKKVDREFKLSDRQRVEVRLFCLGYTRGRLAALRV
jgi:hypothetical protein